MFLGLGTTGWIMIFVIAIFLLLVLAVWVIIMIMLTVKRQGKKILEDLWSARLKIENPGDEFWGRVRENVKEALSGDLDDKLSSGIGGKVKKTLIDVEEILTMVAMLASVNNLALPYHRIELLDLEPKLEAKLKENGINTVFKLRGWLKSGDGNEISGVGTKEIGEMHLAVGEYFDRYKVVELTGSLKSPVTGGVLNFIKMH